MTVSTSIHNITEIAARYRESAPPNGSDTVRWLSLYLTTRDFRGHTDIHEVTLFFDASVDRTAIAQVSGSINQLLTLHPDLPLEQESTI